MGEAVSYFRRAVLLTFLVQPVLAGAQIIAVGPDECPAPADAPQYNTPPDVDAGDLNSWRRIAETQRTVIDVTVDRPPAANRVFQRYDANPATGEVFHQQPAPCGDAEQ